MTQLVFILDNLRSAGNVGSLLRTADAMGVGRVVCCGTTPYPRVPVDTRDPVVSTRNHRAIAKTALGAEATVATEYFGDTAEAIDQFESDGYCIYGLEQHAGAVNALTTNIHLPAAIVVGNEVSGLSQSVVKRCNVILEIPQVGQKESLNVAVATGIIASRFMQLLPPPK